MNANSVEKLSAKLVTSNSTCLYTGEKAYKCGQCGEAFTLPRTLKIHIMTLHAGERPIMWTVRTKFQPNWLAKNTRHTLVKAPVNVNSVDDLLGKMVPWKSRCWHTLVKSPMNVCNVEKLVDTVAKNPMNANSVEIFSYTHWWKAI